MALYNLGYNGFQPGRYKDEQRREQSATTQCGKGRSVRFMNMRTAMRNLFFGLLILGTAGCTVGHDYRKPEASVPENWSRPPADEQTAAQVDLNTWWTIFQDPELDSLLERAVRTNKDLKLAEARIRESRALRSSASAAQFPTINTSANYTRYRHSDNTPGATPASPWYDLYQGGFDASWEIDIFGGLRRAVEATGADLDASVENRRDVLVTLLSEVARNYLQVRGSRLRIAIARENIIIQQQTLELTRARFQAGLSSELDVSQARSQLAVTESSVPAQETTLRQSIYQLSVLLGLSPTALSEELDSANPLTTILPPEIPTGVPSDILRRRPDVRRAERQLAAASARVGVAVADLFPKFSLTGALQQQSVSAGDIVDPKSSYTAIGPTIRWPIFDAGRIRANIAVQNARQEQALIQYEQAVLNSLKDVENALVAYSGERTTRTALARAVDSDQRSSDIAGELYAKGLVPFLNVLDSQRSLFQSQDQLAQSDLRAATDLVALFKALGGGWESRSEPETVGKPEKKQSEGEKKSD